jgi:DNA-binding transcriptional ArsR family regulator
MQLLLLLIIITLSIIRKENMPNSSKADLVIHPVRLQILQALAEKSRTTQEIAEVLPMVSQPSLYRHLKMLLEGGMVVVAETRQVRGIQEKRYQLAQSPHLSAEDFGDITKEQHLHYFNAYAASLLKGFADYLEESPEKPDLLADQTGYTETAFYASSEEMGQFFQKLLEAIKVVASNPPAPGRRRRKLAIISHPLSGKEE